MAGETDRFWKRVARPLQRQNHLNTSTLQEAQADLDAAGELPLSDQESDAIIHYVTDTVRKQSRLTSEGAYVNESLAAFQPTIRSVPETSYGSAERAEWGTLQDPGRRRTWRFAMRKIIVPVGVAAALLIGAGVVLLSLSQRANAANMLKAAAAASRAFDGWIHATFDQIPGFMQTPGEGEVVKSGSVYVQPAKGIFVRDYQSDHGRRIIWDDHAAGIQKSYSSVLNEIVVADTAPADWASASTTEQILQVLRAEDRLTPWQIGQTLFAMPTMDGIAALVDTGWCTVAVVRDSADDRYTLTFNPQKLTDPADAAKSSLVLLVDRKTSLASKWLATFPDGTMAVRFTYNDPVLNDVYDLGVPRTTSISDNRTGGNPNQQDASAVLDRLDKRVASDEQLGTYTAVLTQSFESPGQNLAKRCVMLYGRQDKSYYFGSWNTKQAPFLMELSGWPTPDVSQVIASGRNVLPSSVLTSSGLQTWQGWRDGDKPTWSLMDAKDLAAGVAANSTLSGEIWPGRHRIDFQHGSRVKIKMGLLAASDRPGQTGIRVEESGAFIEAMEAAKVEMIWWMDPARNDVPTEKIERTYGLGGELGFEDDSKFTEYARMPSGEWYPTAWTTTSTNYNGQRPQVVRTVQTRLQLILGMALEGEWFHNPKERYESATQPAAN